MKKKLIILQKEYWESFPHELSDNKRVDREGFIKVNCERLMKAVNDDNLQTIIGTEHIVVREIDSDEIGDII